MSDDLNTVSTHFGGRPSSVGPARRVPFRIVVIGDFGLSPGKLHGFDDQDLDEALASARPRLDLAVTDHLGGGDRPLGIDIEIGALRDFSAARDTAASAISCSRRSCLASSCERKTVF